MFGGGQPAQNSQSLDLRSSLFGVSQKVRLPNGIDPLLLDPRFQQDGQFAGVQSNLSYNLSRQTDGSTIGVGLNGFVADYSVAPESPVWGTGGVAQLSTRLTRRLTFVSAAQSAYGSTFNFSPLGQLGAFDPALSSQTLGATSLDVKNITAVGSAGVNAVLSKRSSVSVTAQAQRTFFFSRPQDDYATVGSSLIYTHQLFRKLSFMASYRREQVLQLNEEQPEVPARNSLDVGLNYGDALQLRLTRRTTLSFTIGAGSGRALNQATRYYLLGSATLAHTMGRTWLSSVSYNRSLGFLSAFRQPVLQDTVQATLGGQLARRVSFSSQANYVRGYVALDSTRSFDSYTATSGLNFALTRRISAFAQYNFYGNSIPEGASPLPFLTTFRRSAIVGGLSLWAPLYSNPRLRR